MTSGDIGLILGWLAVINAWTFLRFWQDKVRARSGDWRVAEADLLGPALLGGTPAAYLARALLRHKTRKRSFSDRLFQILVVQIAAIVGLGVSAV